MYKAGHRLTEAGVQEILRLRGEGKTYQQVASCLGITTGTVYNVCKGRTWKWLTGKGS